MITARSAENLSNMLVTLAKLKQEKTLKEEDMAMMAPYFSGRGSYYGNTGNANVLKANSLSMLNSAKVGGVIKPTITRKPDLSLLSPEVLANSFVPQYQSNVYAAKTARDNWVKSTMNDLNYVPPKGMAPEDVKNQLAGQWMADPMNQKYTKFLNFAATPQGARALTIQ